MAGKVQLTPEQEAELRRLHSEGVSRNQIAKRLGIAGATLTRIAGELVPPVEFDQREYLKAAVEQRAFDLKAKRQALAEDAVAKAQVLVGDILRPTEITALGQGPEGTGSQWFTTKVSRPDPRGAKDLATAASTLVNTALRIAEFDRDRDAGTDSMLGMLDGLSVGIATLADRVRTVPPAEDSLDPEL